APGAKPAEPAPPAQPAALPAPPSARRDAEGRPADDGCGGLASAQHQGRPKPLDLGRQLVALTPESVERCAQRLELPLGDGGVELVGDLVVVLVGVLPVAQPFRLALAEVVEEGPLRLEDPELLPFDGLCHPAKNMSITANMSITT